MSGRAIRRNGSVDITNIGSLGYNAKNIPAQEVGDTDRSSKYTEKQELPQACTPEDGYPRRVHQKTVTGWEKGQLQKCPCAEKLFTSSD